MWINPATSISWWEAREEEKEGEEGGPVENGNPLFFSLFLKSALFFNALFQPACPRGRETPWADAPPPTDTLHLACTRSLSGKKCVKPAKLFLLIKFYLRLKFYSFHVKLKIWAEGAPRFELGTSRSAVECSTTELHPPWNSLLCCLCFNCKMTFIEKYLHFQLLATALLV